jgi:glycosyltransferase involved in cell wall biosynthesis
MSAHDRPLVSVITPVFNGAAFLAECIESVLNQTYPNYEHIIINNCSTDHTLEIATSYARRDNRIHIHNNDTFVGVIDNHNIGFKLISTNSKYCKIVCADDFIFPDCVMRLVDAAEAHPSVGLVGSYSIAGKRVMWDGLEYEKQVVDGREISRATLLGGPYVFGSPTSLLYRSDLIRKTKAFYPNSSPHADTTACYQSLEESDFGFVHQVLSYTRIHPDSQTSKSIKFGTIKLALIGDLTRFGPKYLSSAELERRLEELTDSYYRVLARAFVERLGNKQVWQQQKDGLRELGLGFSRTRLWKTALLRGVALLAEPRHAVTVLRSMKRSERDGEGRYY